MITTLLLLFPLIAAFVVYASPNNIAGRLAYIACLIELVFAFAAYNTFTTNPDALSLTLPWIESLNIQFSIGMDGLSLIFVLLTTLLLPMIIYSSINREIERSSSYYALMLFMQMALIGVFVANDGFLFYVFWELALIPIYFICLIWGGENRQKITFKFFVYTLLGSLFMLIAFIYLYQHSDVGGQAKSWDVQALYQAGKSLSLQEQSFVFWMIFLAFGIKLPIFPLHTWQPDTYVVAPTEGTMLLSGIMLKMGSFGLIKWLMPMVPLAVDRWSGVAIALSIIGIVYGSILAMTQKDFKRLIAYSSIAHVGMMAAGIFVWNQQGVQGAVFQMVSHGIIVVGLFLVAEILMQHKQSRDLDHLGGIRLENNHFGVLFLIITLGSIALPFTNGFVGEFLLLAGILKYKMVWAVVAGLSVIFGAVYMLRAYQKIMLGDRNVGSRAFGKLASNQSMVLVVAASLIIVLGLYPNILMSIIEPAVGNYLGK